jgi:hypothetical protein
MRQYPALVAKLVVCYDGWIVGSAAKPDAELENVRDWDVIIPYSEWSGAAQLIPLDAKVNTFGGWKCISEGKIVDVWPDDLTKVLTNFSVNYIWHPRSNTRFRRF